MDLLKLDERVCEGMGKMPGETLAGACRRALVTPGADVRRRVAAHILLGDGDVWESMERADAMLSLACGGDA